MGMYTQFFFQAELIEPCPSEVVDTLMFMVGDLTEEPGHPDHPLFSNSRWRNMLRMDSYYFDADTHSTLNRDLADFWSLTVLCNFKNYHREIEHFLDWIEPYCALNKERQFMGFHYYEEAEEPTLIFFTGKDI